MRRLHFSPIGGIILALATVAVAEDMIEYDFKEVEALAIGVLDDLQSQSFEQGREYCGYVLWQEGALAISTIVAGAEDSCDLPVLSDKELPIASLHTHGNYDPDYDSELPSLHDVMGDSDEETIGFVGTPGGRVWLIDPALDEIIQICGVNCITRDPNYTADEHEADIPVAFTRDELAAFLSAE